MSHVPAYKIYTLALPTLWANPLPRHTFAATPSQLADLLLSCYCLDAWPDHHVNMPPMPITGMSASPDCLLRRGPENPPMLKINILWADVCGAAFRIPEVPSGMFITLLFVALRKVDINV